MQYVGETGKLKNCNVWADYEAPGTSETARLCNGGLYKGELHKRCPSIEDCAAETARKKAEEGGRVHLPVVQTQPTASRPVTTAGFGRPMYPTTVPNSGGGGFMPTPVPGANAVNRYQPGHYQPPQAPQPVIPPATYPMAMQTPYVHGPLHGMGGITPTFLPMEGEGILERLGKNVAQGLIGSTGWHVFSMAQSVDFFSFRR